MSDTEEEVLYDWQSTGFSPQTQRPLTTTTTTTATMFKKTNQKQKATEKYLSPVIIVGWKKS